MSPLNQPPPVTDAATVLTLAFPYQLGQAGFPAMADPNKAIFYSIVALLLTGVNERVMHPDMGVNLHRLVFENLTPILQAQIATEVTRAIETYEDRAEVLAVDTRISATRDGVATAIMVDVLYRVAGQEVGQQVEVPVGGGTP
jgi:phage baseplate assembly protein W